MTRLVLGAIACALAAGCGHSMEEMQALQHEEATLRAQLAQEQQASKQLDDQLADKPRGRRP